MLVLLLVVGLVVAPHMEHLAWWANSVLALLLVWRVWLTLAQRPLPGRFVMLPLLLATAGAVYLQHRTLAGQEAGVTFLLMLMALKLLEMRARRDIFVVIFLSFFILLTQFLYSQDLPVAAITVTTVIALFFVLVGVNLDEVDLPAARKLKLVGITLAKSVPLAAALFLLFPRISGPLWGMPGDSGQSNTGLSNSMSPGTISRLLESDAVAFRVRFESRVPANSQLYWRGPVFTHFNGRTWTPLSQRVKAPAVAIDADLRSAVAYSVILEPHKRDWLFGLETPAALPELSQHQARFTADLQMLTNGLITERIRYDMRSYTSYRMGVRATPEDLEGALSLPTGYNPRSKQFAAELRARVTANSAPRGASDAQLMRAVLDHLRTGDYSYTMAPPPGPQLGRRVPVRHPARLLRALRATFAFLMRALEVPRAW
jgi:hypothetical protein